MKGIADKPGMALQTVCKIVARDTHRPSDHLHAPPPGKADVECEKTVRSISGVCASAKDYDEEPPGCGYYPFEAEDRGTSKQLIGGGR